MGDSIPQGSTARYPLQPLESRISDPRNHRSFIVTCL
jgi:hypothetical protein